jgi:proteic killer suppression protein
LIIGFKCKETKKIFEGMFSKKLPHDIQEVARRKLRMLNNAVVFNDLRSPPSNHLEQMSGDRQGQYSVRIDDQWRICFRWENGNCMDVEIIDYH